MPAGFGGVDARFRTHRLSGRVEPAVVNVVAGAGVGEVVAVPGRPGDDEAALGVHRDGMGRWPVGGAGVDVELVAERLPGSVVAADVEAAGADPGDGEIAVVVHRK